MEPHKKLELADVDVPSLEDGPHGYFTKALAFAKAHYAEEMAFIASMTLDRVTPELFFREYIWVVHATGFSAKAVGKFMPRLVEAYGPLDALADEDFVQAMARVKDVCNNVPKARAVHSTARLLRDGIRRAGWDEFKDESLSSPEKLQKLPFIGPITRFHLARNIGILECVKPDLHLVRMAEHWGFKDCVEMCEAVRPEGMPLGIVDLALWYMASTQGTGHMKKPGMR